MESRARQKCANTLTDKERQNDKIHQPSNILTENQKAVIELEKGHVILQFVFVIPSHLLGSIMHTDAYEDW